MPGLMNRAMLLWVACASLLPALLAPAAANAARSDDPQVVNAAPARKPAPAPTRARPTVPVSVPVAADAAAVQAAQAARPKRIGAVRSWGYQLANLDVEEAAASPYDLLVIDATTGHAAGRHFRRDEIERLKKKPDGSPRIVVSYLSIGEAEDHRPDYFVSEYLSEDPPDWLLSENPRWKGNRSVRFCYESWQRTIVGDERGRSVYNSVDPSPLQRLVELGFDGVYLDRVDIYAELEQECPDGARTMIDFVARIAAHARRTDPGFIVILQNAEELVRHKKMMNTIDAIAKEDLFYGADHSESLNSPVDIREALQHLKAAKAAGRPVFVIDYVLEPSKKADARKRIEEQGFIPYIGPRDLGRLWLSGRDF
jgi:cysteinyl-tRNA synthetase